MSLYIENIQLKRGLKVIVDNLDLNINQGQCVALLGLNGTGKTTLIQAVAGLLPITKGNILFNNQSIYKMKPKERAQKIAYVPQHMVCDLEYKVSDFILMGITPYLNFWQTPKKSDYKQIDEVLKALNLNHLSDSPLNQISGGERQMVYLARALMQKAQVMLLDEPTAHLDFKRQHEFFQALKNIKNDKNPAILIALHDPNLALQYADRIIVLHQQQLLGDICLTEKVSQDRKIALKKLTKVLKKAYGKEIELNQEIESSILYRKK